jgi:hypothetical protein
MEDLDEMAAQLMAAVRNLPPGQQRQDALKEVGRIRSRMYALLRPISATKLPNPLPSKPLRASRRLLAK